jgi:hypothetical protein
MKYSALIILGYLLLALSCKHANTESKESETKINLDSLIYNNYIRAVQNDGTFQFFLVIKVKNLNNGEIREVCTKGDFLEGAIHHEYAIAYDSIGIIRAEKMQIDNKSRYFEFKDTAALKNLGIENYTMDELSNFEKTHKIDSLALALYTGNWSMKMPKDKTMLLYAHSLFNRGILTGENNCFGGALEKVGGSLTTGKQNLKDR